MLRSPALLVAAFALWPGCTIRTTIDHETLELDDVYSQLDVDVDAGAVRVAGHDDAGTIVEVERDYNGDARPDLDVFVQDDVLTLDGDCPPSHRRCQLNLDITAPEHVDVALATGAGDVRVHEMLGRIDATTGAGDIWLQHPTATTDVSTGAGDIVVTGASAPDLEAHTGTGAIDLVYLRAHERIDADSGAGPIAVLVPTGRYDIDATTGVGRVILVDVVDDSASERTIRLHTGVGDIRVTGYQATSGYLPACTAADGDPYTLTDADIVGDTLYAEALVSGGCVQHSWTLCWPDGAFMESHPVQARLDLLHDDWDDPCDAIVEQRVGLDLTPLSNAYYDMYGRSSGTIIVQLDGFSLDYDF